VACVAGSMMRGVLTEFRIMMAFSIDKLSAGNPSFLKVRSYASEARKVLMLNSSTLNAPHQSWRWFSLEHSFSPPR